MNAELYHLSASKTTQEYLKIFLWSIIKFGGTKPKKFSWKGNVPLGNSTTNIYLRNICDKESGPFFCGIKKAEWQKDGF